MQDLFFFWSTEEGEDLINFFLSQPLLCALRYNVISIIID